MGGENPVYREIIDVSRLRGSVASMWEWVRIVGRGVASALKSRRDLALENIALRHWGTAVSSELGIAQIGEWAQDPARSTSVIRRYLSWPPAGIRDIRSAGSESLSGASHPNTSPNSLSRLQAGRGWATHS